MFPTFQGLHPPAVRLVPFHGSGEPPSYFVFAGLVFTPCTVPYLKSEFGKDYDYDSPVKLLVRVPAWRESMVIGWGGGEAQHAGPCVPCSARLLCPSLLGLAWTLGEPEGTACAACWEHQSECSIDEHGV